VKKRTLKDIGKERLLKNILKRKPYLCWDVRDIEALSKESIVETILTRGDFNDFLELKEILGMREVAEIFYKQISNKRKNYSPKTENYFRILFERYLKHV